KAHDAITLAIGYIDAREEVQLLESLRTPRVGPRQRLEPEALPGDGRLYVATLGVEGREQMLDWLHHPDDGEPAPLKLREAQRVEIAWHGHPVHLDDKFEAAPREPARMTVALQVGALRVLVPGRAATDGDAPAMTAPLSTLFPAADAIDGGGDRQAG